MEELYGWRILIENDLEEAKRFVYEYDSKQLSLAKIFEVKHEEIGRRNIEQTAQLVKNGTSYGCFHKVSNKLVAIIQSSVLVKDAPQAKLSTDENCSPELSALLRFMEWMFKDIFTELGATKLLLHSCAAVSDKFKNGLLDKAESLVRECAQRFDCDYEIALMANAHTARVFMKEEEPVSFTREIAFCDYVDPDTGMKPNLELLPVYKHAKITYKKVRPVFPELSTRL